MEKSGKRGVGGGGEDEAVWYLAIGERPTGPLRASEVLEGIQTQRYSWVQYIWKKGQPEWKRICDLKEFQSQLPRQPSVKPKPAPPSPDLPPQNRPKPIRNWFLHQNGTQYGPYSQGEIQEFLETGRVRRSIYAWCQGMPNWEKLESIDVFSASAVSQTPAPPPIGLGGAPMGKAIEKDDEKKQDRRKAPRKPLVAKIIMADDQAVILGVCRDISVGGLQVLTDTIPEKVGDRLKMNISSITSGTSHSGQTLEPIVAEGTIVRILEDGRGFSFRFQKLSEQARKAIESYVEESDD